jgi:NTP pyrophosphatase (non-canonical NTP hydrolase)
MSKLTFDVLREANQKRRELEPRTYLKCKEWIPAQWLQALVGEVGELANEMKKVDRGDYDDDASDRDAADVRIAKELADIQTYLDILAAELGVDLGQATIDKFNEVSTRVGSSVTICQVDPDGSYGVMT